MQADSFSHTASSQTGKVEFSFSEPKEVTARGDGCTDLGVDFKLVNLLSISTPHLNLHTEKLNARFQHFVSL